jgi:natural product biosynthesis luciferase-like monooxygenase protein
MVRRGHTIAGVITPDGIFSRWAESNGIRRAPVDGDMLSFAAAEPFDVLFSIVNGSIIPSAVLELPRKCAVNYHDGPLPRYAGFHTPVWALLNGERTYGITWHLITAKVDDGSIVKQRWFDVAPEDTAFALNTKCYQAAVESFEELLAEIAEDRLEKRAQDRDQRRFYSRYKRPEHICVIDWNAPAEQIEALARALDFGQYPNPVGVARFLTTSGYLRAGRIEVASDLSAARPGTVVAVSADSFRVATGTREVTISAISDLYGRSIAADRFWHYGIREEMQLPVPRPEDLKAISGIASVVAAKEQYWTAKAQSIRPARVAPGSAAQQDGPVERFEIRVPSSLESLAAEAGCTRAEALIAAIGCFFARTSGDTGADVGFRDLTARPLGAKSVEDFFEPMVPLKVLVDATTPVSSALAGLVAEIRRTTMNGGYVRDLAVRYPELRDREPGFAWPVAIQVGEADGESRGTEATFVIDAEGAACSILINSASIETAVRFETFLNGFARAKEQPLSDIAYLPEQELTRLISDFNNTRVPFESDRCVHQLFEAQASKAPNAPAVAFEGEELSYAQLNARANAIANHLIRAGVGPDRLVGVCIERSIDMLAALLGVLKAGGAYVPLDPEYPSNRIGYLVQDAAPRVLLTQRRLLGRLPASDAEVMCVEDLSGNEPANPEVAVSPANLAYVIYTSGSTGQPKGVMITHRNVVNFFTGMDGCAEASEKGVWLAVTSISFDISVFELFWTLARGFKVVIQGEDRAASVQSAPVPESTGSAKPVDFSLFYFAADEGSGTGDKYRLLKEGAKFADENGFSAVWTPERHFHAFGGLYPNPSVISAALAAMTKRVKIRAGSVVLPLHHPLRVAEEWSLVDNISNGRVGISFAAGWQANDFVLAPDNHANNKQLMFEHIETVRRLWRGEAITYKNGRGVDTPTRTLPRPVQKELPVWVTAAMNVDTFIAAGKIGANVLTHLLGQKLEQVATKIEAYRKAWREAGHPGSGHVTLMLHTYVGENYDEVKETVRGPLSAYLRTAADLIKNAPWSFPVFNNRPALDQQTAIDLNSLTTEEMDAIVDHAFERYFETSGLFGTPEACIEMARKVRAIDVDEIGCLVDFGIPEDLVLESLPLLNRVRATISAESAPVSDYSIPAQIRRHNVTHMQCTPSMARMLVDGGAAPALATLRKMFVGGEAITRDLAERLVEIGPEVHNMFGPTETTIWSTTHRLAKGETAVPIGRPIANTQIYVLDSRMQLLPAGSVGELYIGGDGVARGYLNRETLSAEKFVRSPFSGNSADRLYKTGDLASITSDGLLLFHGRIDNQVKILGHRIELGEIESVLNTHPAVRESAVVAREGGAGKRLLAYVVPRNGNFPTIQEMRTYLGERLPEYMVPAAFMELAKLPLTPNGKVDRKALPDVTAAPGRSATTYTAPQGELEDVIAGLWQEALHVEKVGRDDNFFDLGAHSLMVVQISNQLKQKLGRDISVVQMFRYPTVSMLAAHLNQQAPAAEPQQVSARAKARREYMNRARAGVS